MFSEILKELQDNRMPDPETLANRFDFALTKKLGIIKMPPAFWMGDPKINPRADHLFWAALLLRDRQRVELAISVLSAEMEQKKNGKMSLPGDTLSTFVCKLVSDLLDQFADPLARKKFEQELSVLIPEWFPCEARQDNE